MAGDAERARALSLLKDEDGKYVLDDRARRKCPDCEGRKVLRTGKRFMWSGEPETEVCAKCGGSGTITRPDVGLVIAVLEKAGYRVERLAVFIEPRRWFIWESSGRGLGQNADILVAACQALGVEVPA